jgi:hypothetical protein
MRTILLAGLLLIGGCSAAERRADDVAATSSPDDVANAVDQTSNALGNAMDAAGNPPSNGTSNVTVLMGPAFCPILKKVAPPEDCAAITAQADNLEAGVGAFNAPETMVMGEPVVAKFAVGAADVADETRSRVGGTIAKTIEIKTKLGRYMTARLSGAGFKIVADGAPERDLGASGVELWTWQVTPERKGKLELLLTVSVEAADAGGQRTRIKLATKSVPVEVGVTAADKRREAIDKAKGIADDTEPLLKSWTAWIGTLALLIGAISAVVVAIRMFGKKKDPPTPPSPPKEGDKP